MADANNIPVWPGWETVRLIGRGSYGAVYEIQREMPGYLEKAAMKVISIPKDPSEISTLRSIGYDKESITERYDELLQRIVNEYSLMRKMSGTANIVSCEDIMKVQHGDGIGWDVYIRMELLTPLPDSLGKTMTEARVIKIGADLCRALDLCRKNNIVHRDIKPQNIFVSANGDYKLGDFGVAKTVEGTGTGTIAGTYKYMPPEVYNHKPYGTRADIYSLGMVLYWLLNKRRLPFFPLPPEKVRMSQEDKAVERRLRGEQLSAPVNGSEELKRIVLKACAYDPDNRYQSAEEMLADLEALSSGKAVSAGPSVSSTPAKTPVEADEATVGAWKASVSQKPAESPEETDDEATVGVWNKPKPEKKPEPEKKTELEKPATPPKKKSKAIVWGVAAAVVLAVALLMIPRIKQNNQYNAAVVLMNEGKYDEAITAFKALDEYNDSAERVLTCENALKDIKYNAAVSLMNEGKYEEAISVFEAMDGYKDSTEQIKNCDNALKEIKYSTAVDLMNSENYEKALVAFEQLDSYKDSSNQIKNCRMALDYNIAVELVNQGKIIEAYERLTDLNGYKDSTELAESINEALMEIRQMAEENVGDIVSFGAYEQDNNLENGKEAIEWLVLAKEDNRMLVISQKALDCQPYNMSYTEVTWETCSLRKWLNGQFLTEAFSAEEQANIATTNVSADKNSIYSTDPGNATNDKVFLLSIAEAEKYFKTKESRMCAPTAYAKAQGAYTNDGIRTASGEAACWWWLRSPGYIRVNAAGVYSGGSVDYCGYYVNCVYDAVRPALWINLDS